MKLVRITTLYPSYLALFYAQRRGLAERPHAEQQQALALDASGWADFWGEALEPLGYEVLEISYNAEPLQRMWAKENDVGDYQHLDLKKIALVQIQRFRPDVLWFDDHDGEFLQEIRAATPSIRLVLGWSGSAIPRSSHWRHVDLALSCAQESVEFLASSGVRAEQLHHGFDPRINDRTAKRDKIYDLTFIGQLVRNSQFHLQREQLLLELAKLCRITIFSASARLGAIDDAKALVALGMHRLFAFLRGLGADADLLASLPKIGWLAATDEAPLPRAVHPDLKALLRPEVYGMEMFQVLRDSRVALNIHADSSPRFASNMRLFEITGVGTCMVVDFKENISQLFVPDAEIVVYRNSRECIEKVTWLREHPEECREIASAGQKRTLSCHTFAHRAADLDGIIKRMFSA